MVELLARFAELLFYEFGKSFAKTKGLDRSLCCIYSVLWTPYLSFIY